jgi:hypothetical protein
MRIRCALAILLFSLCCRTASAQLTLVMQFSTDPSGISLSGGGTAAASASFTTVQAFGGSLPTGVTKAVGSNSFTLTTTFDVKVFKGALDVLDVLSTSYTLLGALQSADLIDSWQMNSIPLSTTNSTISSTETYSSVLPFTLSINVPFSATTGAISNSIMLTAIAN